MADKKELLALAAKAAGLNEHTWCQFWQGMAIPGDIGCGWQHDTYWNPLNDDAQAFRLAVDLGIEIHSIPHGAYILCRRTIVQRAAEIGRRIE